MIFANWSGFLCFLPFKPQNFLNSLYFFEVSSYICDFHILPKMQYFLVISEFNPTWNVAISWMHTAKKNVKKHKTVNLQNKYFKFAKISRLNVNIGEHILSKLITIAFLVSTFTENWAKHVIFTRLHFAIHLILQLHLIVYSAGISFSRFFGRKPCVDFHPYLNGSNDSEIFSALIELYTTL